MIHNQVATRVREFFGRDSLTDTETDNDAGRTDYQADPNTNIYTKHGCQIVLRITRFVILVIRPDYQKFCLRSTPGITGHGSNVYHWAWK